MSVRTIHPNQTHEAGHRQPTAKPAAKRSMALMSPANAVDLQRALTDPRRVRPADILALQRMAGNRAVSRLIQTKLTVGPAGDRYEQEADRVAAQVMTMPVPAAAQTQPAVQRQAEEEEEIQTKPLAASITPLVQRAPEDEEELQTKPIVQRAPEEEDEIQTKPALQRASSGAGFEVSGAFEQQLSASRGGGSPLPAQVRAFMEPRFGADFSGVRIHTGSESAQLNRSVSAQAFTHGQDIYLGAGKDDLESAQGKQLLAHELTHVVQQTGGVQRLAVQRRVMTRQQFTNNGTLTAGRKLGGSSFSKLLTAVDKYHAAIASHDAVERKKGADNLVTLCNAWLVSYNKRKKKKTQDAAKKINVEEVLRQAQLEPPSSHVGALLAELPLEMQQAYRYYQNYTGDNEHVKYARLLSVKQAFSGFVATKPPTTPGYGAVADFDLLLDGELQQIPAPKQVNDALGGEEKVVNMGQDVPNWRQVRFGKTRVPAEANCALASCAAVIRHATGRDVTTGDLVLKIKEKRGKGAVATEEFVSIYQHPQSFTQDYYTGANSLDVKINDDAAQGIIDVAALYGVQPAGPVSASMELQQAKQEMTQLLTRGSYVFAVLVEGEGHWNFAHGGSSGEVEFIDYQSDHALYTGAMLDSNPVLGIRTKIIGSPTTTTRYIAFAA